MAVISFSPEEMEELKRIDAEIDADDNLTDQEIVDSWRRDHYREPKTSQKEREYLRKYYQKNRDHLLAKGRLRYEQNREYMKEYREKNREMINARQRIYARNHAEQQRQYAKQYYELHREEENAKSRAYYQKNKEKLQQYSREYYHKNKEKYREYHRKYYHRRKSENDECTGEATGHGRPDTAPSAEGSR